MSNVRTAAMPRLISSILLRTKLIILVSSLHSCSVNSRAVPPPAAKMVTPSPHLASTDLTV